MVLHMSVTFFLLVMAISLVSAGDPSPLQDFCVAVKESDAKVYVNGMVCMNPKQVKADHFLYRGLNKPADTSKSLMGTKATRIGPNFGSLMGLNTLGLFVFRLDFAPKGLRSPHLHPRSTELFYVEKGHIFVGFVTSKPYYRLFTKILKAGDLFVFPQGLIHFQLNVGKMPACAIGFGSSQNPGLITIANNIFGAKPPVPTGLLAKAFMLKPKMVAKLQTKFQIVKGYNSSEDPIWDMSGFNDTYYSQYYASS